MGNNKNILIIAAVLLIVMIGGCSYNGMITAEQTTKASLNQVNNMCSRRYELVNQLMNVVKGEKDFEQQTLTGIVEARAKATQITIDASNMTPENMKAFQEAQGQLGSSLGRLLAVSENYPNLKSNQAFSDLRVEITGSQNRVNNAILDFNRTIQDFNNKVIRFPSNIIARILGFAEKNYFPVDPSTQKVPDTKF